MSKLEEKQTSRPKIVIIGAGFVGSTFAYSILIHGLASQIVMIDANRDRAEGEVMDLDHAMSFTYPTKIRVGDYSDCKNADIVVIAADKGEKMGQSRLNLAQGNLEIMRMVIPKIIEQNKECILLVVSNPLDIMTYAALKLSGFPRNRVIGSGTVLDTARLRYLLGEYLQIDPRNVHAYVIGEHGDSEIPVWSLASVAGIRLRDYCSFAGVPYGEEKLNDLFLRVRNAGYDIIRLKGHTNYAIALGMTKIVESIIRDENAVITVSCFLEKYHEVSDVCLSVPAILNKNGIKETISIPLDPNEAENFRRSATIVREVIDSIGI